MLEPYFIYGRSVWASNCMGSVWAQYGTRNVDDLVQEIWHSVSWGLAIGNNAVSVWNGLLDCISGWYFYFV